MPFFLKQIRQFTLYNLANFWKRQLQAKGEERNKEQLYYVSYEQSITGKWITSLGLYQFAINYMEVAYTLFNNTINLSIQIQAIKTYTI